PIAKKAPPGPKPAAPAPPPSKPATLAAPVPLDDLDFDLPALAAADLPAPRAAGADLPAPWTKAAPPAKAAAAPPRPAGPAPAVKATPGVPTKPAPVTLSFEDDLPAPRAELPQVRAGDPKPAPYLSDLPVAAQSDASGAAET